MSYSLSQAATATGKDRSTIQRAIKSGRISAILNEAGAYRIDPAELHRVFPPVASDEGKPATLQQNAMGVQSEIESENRELKARVELLREMVDDLRGRLDKEAEERRRLTLMLTGQHQPPQTANQNQTGLVPSAVRLPFWLAFVAVSTAAASWYIWPWLIGNH